MSTTEGATRQPAAGEVGLASLAHIEPDFSADDLRLKTHYVWNPFENIKLVGPDGLKIRLGKDRSFYGQGRPGESYEDYMNRAGDSLRRCFLYPIYNIRYDDTIYNVRPQEFSEAQRIGGTGNLPGEQPRMIERNMSAGVCAKDFESIWGESHGARSLTPLIGLDEDTAAEIFKLIQPHGYRLISPEEGDEETLFYDLTYAALLRIKGARLDTDLAAIAERTRAVMRSGMLQAIKTAREAWEELHKELNNSKNSRPGKSTPTIYDEQVAFLLNEPLPASVARPRADMESNILKALQQIGASTANTAPPADVNEGLELLREIRAEREALQQEREAFEAARKKGARQN
jgi:hypothetical protein